MKRANLMLAAFALLLGSAGGVRADLVVNGGFETGDFTGWTTTGDYTFNGVASSGYAFGAQSGTYFAFLGNFSPDDTLSQTLATTAGQTYQLSFYLAGDGATPNDFSATVGNTTVFSQTNIPYQDYQQFTSTFTATSSSTSLSFAF
jgi:hypothetical protein